MSSITRNRLFPTFVAQALITTSLVAMSAAPASAAPAPLSGAPMTIVVEVQSGDIVELPFGNPLTDLTETVDVAVTWGDATTDNYTTVGIKTHTYALAGTYTISIGPGQSVNGPWLTIFGHNRLGNQTNWSTHDIRFTDVTSFGDLGISSLSNAFYYAGQLTSVPSTLPSTVTDLNSTFRSAGQFNDPDVSLWDVSNVTSMESTFSGTGSFNQPLNTWDVSNVTSFQLMFVGTSIFNQNLNSWDTSSATNMSQMFQDAPAFNGQISNWDVSNVTSMNNMFRNATSFNQPIGSWNISQVQSIGEMFRNATSFNQPIGNWTTTSMASTFGMFFDATSFNQDISNWNLSQVLWFDSMFENATSFNQNIGNWNVSNMRTATRMFYGATAFNRSLANWSPTRLTNATDFFTNASALAHANYQATLEGWAPTAASNVIFGAPNHHVVTCAGVEAREELVTTKGWTITDLPHGLTCNQVVAANPTATISGYSFESAKLNAARKLAIRRYLVSIPQGSTLTCSGSTAGTRVTAFARKLAKNRATAVCNYAKTTRSDLRIRITTNPASGPTKAARKVVLSYT